MAEVEDGRRGGRLPAWLDWVITIAAGVALALLVRTFVAEVYIVPSGSMLETIQEGDRLVGEKAHLPGLDAEARDVVTSSTTPRSPHHAHQEGHRDGWADGRP